MKQRSEGILLTSQPAWMSEAVKINRDENGRRKPRTVDEEAVERVRAGTTFRFEEIPGDGSVFMMAEIRADERGTQVAFHPELMERLKKVTRGTNWSTALVALADRGRELLAGKRILFFARDSNRAKVPLVSYHVKEASSFRIEMDGKLLVCGNEGRRRVAIPLDVRRPIERAIDDTIPFTHALMALAWFAMDDLEKRKKTLVVPKKEPKKEAEDE